MFEIVYEAFFHPGEVAEIRAFGLNGKGPWEGFAKGSGIVSGYFNNAADFAEAARVLEQMKPKGVYYTANPVIQDFIARAKNRLKAADGRMKTTADDNVQRVRWLLIDFDPVRVAGGSDLNASEPEFEAAWKLRNSVHDWLRSETGAAEGVPAISGNGAHLMMRLPDLPNQPENIDLIRRCLQAIGHRFSDNGVEVDLKVFNPSRIWKLYGTVARKSDHTELRPQRQSFLQFRDRPPKLGDIPVNDADFLKRLAALAPAGNAPPTSPSGSRVSRPAPAFRDRASVSNGGAFDMAGYLTHYGVEFREKQTSRGRMYLLKCCLFDESHRGRDAGILVGSDGVIRYKCFHDSCAGRTWHEARRLISGDDSLTAFASDDFVPGGGGAGGATGVLDRIVIDEQGRVYTKEPIPAPGEIDWREFFQPGKRKGSLRFVERNAAAYLAAFYEPLRCSSNVFRHYEGGVWREFSEGILKQSLTLALKDEATAVRINNSLNLLKGMVNFPDEEWKSPENLINCANGAFDLDQWKLIPHDPGHNFRHILAANYDPAAECPRWIQFVGEVLPRENDAERHEGKAYGDRGFLLQQFMGYSVYPSCRFEKTMMMHGGGQNGKSTILGANRNIIGEENVSASSMSALANGQDNRFGKLHLRDKLLNICSEIETNEVQTTELIKNIVSGEPIEGEMKYGGKVVFTSPVKLIFAMNSFPYIRDKSHGFIRRILFLKFRGRIADDKKDPYLADRLKAERDGIFMWALAGLKILLENGGFAEGGACLEDKDEFVCTVNPVAGFLEEIGLEADPIPGQRGLPSVDLYAMYRTYCEDFGYRPVKIDVLLAEILAKFPDANSSRHYFNGVRKRTIDGVRFRAPDPGGEVFSN